MAGERPTWTMENNQNWYCIGVFFNLLSHQISSLPLDLNFLNGGTRSREGEPRMRNRMFGLFQRTNSLFWNCKSLAAWDESRSTNGDERIVGYCGTSRLPICLKFIEIHYASVSFGKRVAPGNIVVGGFWHQDVQKFSDPTALTDVAWHGQATWAARLSFDKDKQLKVAMNGLNMTDEAQGMDWRIVLNLNCRGGLTPSENQRWQWAGICWNFPGF